jgi:NAD(P)H-flavin reductase
LRATSGRPSAVSQRGLRPSLISDGYFCACIERPLGDIEVEPPGNRLYRRTAARLVSRSALTREIYRVRIETDETLGQLPGQYLFLHGHDGMTRSYSVAGMPLGERSAELHVRQLPGGRLSEWLTSGLPIGGGLEVSGPAGECTYRSEEPDRPILMIATGSGLAPVYGVLSEALRLGHRGPIRLYHGSRTPDGLYLGEELAALEGEHSLFRYRAALSGSSADTQAFAGRADDLALRENPDLGGWLVYLCGHPDMVKSAKRAAYLAGAGLHDIMADPFVLSPASMV